jgi:hypothetical protein
MVGAFKCPKCGITTWGNLKFCPNCGEALTIKCPECKYEWRYICEYKYCPSCGTKVNRISRTATSKEG